MDYAKEYDRMVEQSNRQQEEIESLLESNRRISKAYLQIRSMLNAFDTPYAPTPEQVYEHTEQKLSALTQEVETLRAQLVEVKIDLEHTENCCVSWAGDVGNLSKQLEKQEKKITIDLNIFDDEGNVVDGTTSELTREQISDIIDHASQLILLKRNQNTDGADLLDVLNELEEALVASDVLADE